MDNKNLIPKLRFSEFNNSWEEKKIGEICNSIVPGRNKPKIFSGNIPWITTPDIHHHNIIKKSKKNLFISKEEAKKIGSKIIPKESIVMSCVGELGLVAIVGNDIVINQQLHAFIPKKDNNRFLLYSISNQKKYMEKVATKTAVPYMNKNNCNSIPILCPKIEEQEKIASFLTDVDSKLTQLTKKKALLENYKKGVMQKIFNQKIRFKDNKGNNFPKWEVKTLGGISEIKTGKLDANAMVKNGKYRFYTCAKNYFLINDFAFNTEALLISGNGANVGYIHYYKGKFNAYQRTYVLDSFFGNIIYIKYYLDRFLSERINGEKKEGNTPYIVLSTLKDMIIKFPCLEEQEKIANFLSEIDNKIKTLNTKIENNKSFKKGLLQKMFV